uniref:Putative secreted peptide n=1 Tax=Anopheles braziliensis TaxID=58242 RepID=A0A2M3ZPW2_9DIPT
MLFAVAVVTCCRCCRCWCWSTAFATASQAPAVYESIYSRSRSGTRWTQAQAGPRPVDDQSDGWSVGRSMTH